MTLQDYLADNRISFAEFGRRIGVAHRRTVERYAKGQRTPTPAVMKAITRETKGTVQPNDFYSAEAQ